jgi:UDP-N-acetyl-D-galactosamine dehydrogenase
MLDIIKKKISIQSLTVGVIGLGYVGLPLACAFSKKFKTIGYDKNKNRINELKKNFDTNSSVKSQVLKKINFTSSTKKLKKCDLFILCLPTPVYKNKKPDLSILINALKQICQIGINNKIIIVESTIAPGDSEELLIPFIEKKTSLKINRNFYYGFSPERINPGDKKKNIFNITKIVSGSNPKLTNLLYNLYKKVIKNVIMAKNIKEAEMAKIIENCQRDINIAFMNEIASICELLQIKTNEVLRLASSKWNFLKFKPGFVGGHCIGVDPYYLANKCEKLKYKPKIILSGRYVNENFKNIILKKIQKKLPISKGKRILLMGITYKENCNDIRNSKALELYKLLKKNNFSVDIYDPLVEEKNIKKISELNKNYYDAIIIAVAHTIFKRINYNKICESGKKNFFVFDIQNIFPNKSRSVYL